MIRRPHGGRRAEQMQPARLEDEPEAGARLNIGHGETFGDRDEGALAAVIEIEQRVLAERLDQAHRQFGRALAVARHPDMLGPDAEGGGAGLHVAQAVGQIDIEAGRMETSAAVRLPHLAGHQVHRRRAEEVGDEIADRIGIDVHGRADLHHLALVHHDDAVGQRHRLFLVVGDVDEGSLEHFVQPVAFRAQFAAQLGVEARQRLIEQEGRRIGHQRAGERDTLGFAARALARHLVEQMADAHHLRHFAYAFDAVLRRHLLHAQAELDVLRHVLVREQSVALEHHAEPAVARLQIVDHLPVDADFAGGRILEARDHAQRRGLAASRRPDEHDEFAVLDGEGQVLHRLHGAEILV